MVIVGCLVLNARMLSRIRLNWLFPSPYLPLSHQLVQISGITKDSCKLISCRYYVHTHLHFVPYYKWRLFYQCSWIIWPFCSENNNSPLAQCSVMDLRTAHYFLSMPIVQYPSIVISVHFFYSLFFTVKTVKNNLLFLVPFGNIVYCKYCM